MRHQPPARRRWVNRPIMSEYSASVRSSVCPEAACDGAASATDDSMARPTSPRRHCLRSIEDSPCSIRRIMPERNDCFVIRMNDPALLTEPERTRRINSGQALNQAAAPRDRSSGREPCGSAFAAPASTPPKGCRGGDTCPRQPCYAANQLPRVVSSIGGGCSSGIFVRSSGSTTLEQARCRSRLNCLRRTFC